MSDCSPDDPPVADSVLKSSPLNFGAATLEDLNGHYIDSEEPASDHSHRERGEREASEYTW
jgi:hypothetical protein